MKPIELKSEADHELEFAIYWYAERDMKAAIAFFAAVTAGLESIVKAPKMWPPIGRHHRKLGLKKFPYQIVFRELETMIWVDAIAHNKRKPGYWLARV